MNKYQLTDFAAEKYQLSLHWQTCPNHNSAPIMFDRCVLFQIICCFFSYIYFCEIYFVIYISLKDNKIEMILPEDFIRIVERVDRKAGKSGMHKMVWD